MRDRPFRLKLRSGPIGRTEDLRGPRIKMLPNMLVQRVSRIAAAMGLCILLACPALIRAALPYAVFPAEGSTVPADAPIRLAFPSSSHAGTAGALRIKAANGSIAFSLDIGRYASGTLTVKVGGGDLAIHPVSVDGKEAYLSVPAGTLSAGTAYTAEIDAGAFAGADGAYPAASWGFTTAARPAAGLSGYTGAADGSGDFCTVQGALDFLAVLEANKGRNAHHSVVHEGLILFDVDSDDLLAATL